MGIYVIGDEDTVLGFRLVGGKGVVVNSADQARDEFEKAVGNSDVQLLFVTHKWAQTMADRLNRIKMTRTRPVVMDIPDASGQVPESSVRDLVSRAIGVSM